LVGHRDEITKVAIHPIYSQVATASYDASIKLWDYEQGELEGSMKSHTGKVNYIAYHPNGKILASCSSDMTVKLWNLESKLV
jgi:platelet-activating factor acetylhydrolase IB subunit alpha